MPRKFKLSGSMTISVGQTVELSDEKLQEIADALGVDVDALNTTDLHEAVIEEADQEGIPGLCVYCSGGGIGATHFRDDDGEIEWLDGDDGIEEVTGE